jgi:VWFA-related protein
MNILKQIGSLNSAIVHACFLMAGALLFCVPSMAQNEEVIRVDTDLIPFEATVTNKDGKPVPGLQAKDFRVFEDGVERRVDFFEPIKKTENGRPLSIVFALDVSGSMTPEELVRLRGAMQTFIKRLADYESYFAVMTFGMNVHTLQGFTNKPEKLEKTFDRLLKEQEGLSTHAYDAVDDAIRLIRKKGPETRNNKPMKRAVVVITDGFPVGDTVSPKTVIERANDAETSVYSVILPSFSRMQGSKKPLLTPLEASGLVDRTGGRSFYVTQPDYEPLFRSLAEEITSSYVLAFYPPDEVKRDGKIHHIKIESAQGYQIKQSRDSYQLKKE